MQYQRSNPDASFELPEDITHRQLESYEATNRRVLEGAEAQEPGVLTSESLLGRRDGVLARAAIEGALESGFVEGGENVPLKVDEVLDYPTKVTYWMAEQIASFVRGLKQIDPN